MLSCRYCRALALVLLVGLSCGQHGFQSVSFSVLPHQYNCGEHSMQLLVLPRQSFYVRFKVVDEFETPFEVTNCSICLHWVTSNENGAIFSAGYQGCHVQHKNGRNYLKVRVEELTRYGHVATTHDINMVCPKPEEYGLTPEDGIRHMPQPQMPQPGLGRPVPAQPQAGLGRPVPAQPQAGLGRPLPAQPQPGLGRPVPAQPQPGLGRPLPAQPQPGLGRPVPAQPQPGLGRPVPAQPQPGLGRPVPAQPQPGLGRPVPAQPQPGLGRPVPAQPQPGLGRPVPAQPQPGLGRPVPAQPQPGLGRPVPAQPQPGLGRPVPAQPQPGLGRPLPAQPQPGLGRPVPAQPQPGLGRPLPAQPKPGLGRPVPAQPQPGLGRPLPAQPQPGLGRPVPAQPQPGLGRPLPAQPQPGLGRPVPAQPQPGLGRPVPAQPQPGLGRPVPHFSPIYGTGTHLTMEQCRVLGSKIPCVDTYDQETCHQASCCYDDSDLSIPCYYGNTVTVRCLKEGHFILVVSRDMSDYPVVLDTVKLSYAQAGCDPVSRTEAFLVFRFPLTRCGTTVQVLGDKLIYENQLISDIDIQNGPDGSITRDSTFILHARCIYNATGFLPVQAEVLLPPTPAPVSQMGPLRLELRIATDASYKSYYLDGDYPVVKVLRDPVYVEVRILQRTDPSLVLVLHDCWATPSANPLEQLQWPILMDGCPFEGDNYRTQRMPPGPALAEMPFPTHYQRFIISTFTFVDSGSQMLLSQLVYLFCSASACIPSQIDPCRTTCSARSSPRGRRFLNPLNRTEPVDLASSHGPVIFPDAEIKQLVSNSSETQTDFNSVALGLLSVVTVSSVVILLTVLWRWNRKRS
ncbi:zona pellucida sperm-binding protein 1 [Paroedura picta]|uniref:zona pellucida sperm-binding protein 1 n=1 Tax=Paroedura picta TaxID=143630 RepID=UPI004056BD74